MVAVIRKFWITSARYLRAIVFTCFNLQVFINVGVALISVYVTSKGVLDIRYRLDSFFVSLAVITPLMSIITTAFNRREYAASQMAYLKSSVLALYLMHRDQHKEPQGNLDTVGDNKAKHAREIAQLLEDFLESVQTWLMRRGAHESQAELMLDYLPTWNWTLALLRNKVNFRALIHHEGEERKLLQKKLNVLSADLKDVYEKMNRIAMWNEKTIVRWGFLKSGENVPPGRTNTLLGNISQALDNLRLIREYRTPVMLRYGVKVLVYIYAVFMGPYFNDICTSFEAYEQQKAMAAAKAPPMPDAKPFEPRMCYVNYICASLFLMSLTMLMRIGSDIEYPFDMKGLDDLFFQGSRELREFTHVQVDERFRRELLGPAAAPATGAK